ncbi:MAG: type II secretion system F family protein [bacterium]|nr:type II secretion system F family protein [bacterium]
MLIFSLLAFLTGSLLALGIAGLAWRSPLQRRLLRLHGADGGQLETGSAGESFLHRLERWLGPLARATGGDSAEARTRLVQAGHRDERALVLFLGGRLAAPVALVALTLLAGPVLGIPMAQRWVACILFAMLGYLGPGLWLDQKRQARQAAIRRGLPDALDLMLVCLEAGLALAGALGRVARELVRTNPPLCEELRLVTREMQAGKSSAEALEAFADRVGIEEVRALVAMLVQSERFGTGVGDALRVHTEGMRRERIQRAEEMAYKAAVKMIIPAAMFIFPATLLVILGPAAIRMFDMFAKN